MSSQDKSSHKRKADVLVIPEIKIYISFEIKFSTLQNNQYTASTGITKRCVESKLTKSEKSVHIIQDDMRYNQYLDAKISRKNLIFYSQVIRTIYLPDRLPNTNQDRHYFPIYIHHSNSEYHAGVLLWEKIIRLSDRHHYRPNILYYYDSRGDKPDDALLDAFQILFPNTIRIIYNAIRHQKHDFLCTAYAFNTADRFLSGESFQNICYNSTSVEELVKYRSLINKMPCYERHDITNVLLCNSGC